MKLKWLMTACAFSLLALTCSVAVAKDNRDEEKGENHGQDKKQYRQFQENQRQFANTYYSQHQNHKVFRQDRRWNDEYRNRLQPGYVLDEELRRMSHPAPAEMIRGLGFPPRGYQYLIVGGHVVLVDSDYRVHDTIRFQLNIGH